MKFSLNGSDILFVHIPRTGGTYIENQLEAYCQTNKKWPKPNLDILFGLHQKDSHHFFTLQHLTAAEIVDQFNINIPDKNFAIVRNPYDRAISLFNWWGGSKRFTNFNNFLDTLEKMDLNNYTHEGIITENLNFNYKNMTDNIHECKYHFIPQYKYVCDDNGDKIVNTFNFGNMQTLNEYLGINNIHFHFNGRSNNLKILTEYQKDRIYNIYRKDFELFGYDKTFNSNSKL